MLGKYYTIYASEASRSSSSDNPPRVRLASVEAIYNDAIIVSPTPIPTHTPTPTTTPTPTPTPTSTTTIIIIIIIFINYN